MSFEDRLCPTGIVRGAKDLSDVQSLSNILQLVFLLIFVENISENLNLKNTLPLL